MIWYLLGVIVITLAFNYLALFYGFKNLSYSMEFDKEVYEIGEDMEITSVVENRKLLTVSHLLISEYFPENFGISHTNHAMFIRPFQRVRRTHKVPAVHRGLYAITDVHLELGDFIGFQTDNYFLKVAEEVLVLPQAADLATSIVPVGAPQGTTTVRRWIIDDPLMPKGVREYTGNEAQKFIHWPSSLKHDHLMVTEFDYTTENSVLVLLNMETHRPTRRVAEQQLLERVISLTRGVLEEFEQLNVPYGFATNAYNERQDQRGYYLQTGLGQNHLDALLRTLAELQYRAPLFFGLTIKNVLQQRASFSSVVIITPKILESYIEPINALARNVGNTVVISLEEEHLTALSRRITTYKGRCS